MRRWAASLVLAAIAGFAGVGCSLFRSTVAYEPLPRNEAAAPAPRMAAQAPDGETRVIMQTRLLERPGGDEYLTTGVWKETTDPLPHELSARLALNGLRVGVINGQLPARLEKLAASDAAVVNSMVRAFLAGRPKAIPVNGQLASCTADVRAELGAEPVQKAWLQADCGIIVTATPALDGTLSVRVEYQIQHGERAFAYQPNSDGTAFDGRHQRTVEPFPTLAFEISLRRGDLILFGTTENPTGTLGHAFFFPPEVDRLRQRVLLMQPYAATPPNNSSLTARQTPAAAASSR